MKVLSIKGNKLTLDLNEQEYNILLRYGLRILIDSEYGKNKYSVLPIDGNYKIGKKTKTFNISEEFSNELISIAVINILKRKIKGGKNK